MPLSSPSDHTDPVAAPPAHPVHALLRAEIARALGILGATAAPDDTAVHDVRRCLKKARAQLRLLRSGFDDITYRREDAALRDAGRTLAPVRDAHSLVAALDVLRERHARALRAANLAALRKRLLARHAQAQARLRAPDRIADCVRMLRDCDERLQALAPAWPERLLIASGLQRIYRNGRRALRSARKQDTPDALHDWRKHVKYLLNAVLALQEIQKVAPSDVSRSADRIADWLGDDHDLALIDALVGRAVREQALRTVIARRHAQLRKRALKQGAKLYDGKPRKFTAALLRRLLPPVTLAVVRSSRPAA
jgi:hypothetical protein